MYHLLFSNKSLTKNEESAVAIKRSVIARKRHALSQCKLQESHSKNVIFRLIRDECSDDGKWLENITRNCIVILLRLTSFRTKRKKSWSIFNLYYFYLSVVTQNAKIFDLISLLYLLSLYLQIYSNVVLIYKNKQKKNIYIYILY